MIAAKIVEPRLRKATVIARSGGVNELRSGVYTVKSQSHGGTYVVYREGRTCTCEDAGGGNVCKHLLAVELVASGVDLSVSGTGTESVQLTERPDYRRHLAHKITNVTACFEQEDVERLAGILCRGIPQPAQDRGRPRKWLASIVYGAILKVYSTMSGRRADSSIRRAVRDEHTKEHVHYNTLFRYMAKPEFLTLLTTLVQVSAAPLSAMETVFAIDGSGFGNGRGTWQQEKAVVYAQEKDPNYGEDGWIKRSRTRKWVKAHVMIGVQSGVVTAAEVTHRDVGESPLLEALVARTSERFHNMLVVTADKGYSSRRAHEIIGKFGATPYIAFKVNATASEKDDPTWARMYHLHQADPAAFRRTYHQRSNIEAQFRVMKERLGFVRSTLDETMYAEVLVKFICHNLIKVAESSRAYGIEPKFFGQTRKETV